MRKKTIIFKNETHELILIHCIFKGSWGNFLRGLILVQAYPRKFLRKEVLQKRNNKGYLRILLLADSPPTLSWLAEIIELRKRVIILVIHWGQIHQMSYIIQHEIVALLYNLFFFSSKLQIFWRFKWAL